MAIEIPMMTIGGDDPAEGTLQFFTHEFPISRLSFRTGSNISVRPTFDRRYPLVEVLNDDVERMTINGSAFPTSYRITRMKLEALRRWRGKRRLVIFDQNITIPPGMHSREWFIEDVTMNCPEWFEAYALVWDWSITMVAIDPIDIDFEPLDDDDTIDHTGFKGIIPSGPGSTHTPPVGPGTTPGTTGPGGATVSLPAINNPIRLIVGASFPTGVLQAVQNLPTGTTVVYSLTGSLPDGLVLSPQFASSRRILGTATTVESDSLTYTATLSGTTNLVLTQPLRIQVATAPVLQPSLAVIQNVVIRAGETLNVNLSNNDVINPETGATYSYALEPVSLLTTLGWSFTGRVLRSTGSVLNSAVRATPYRFTYEADPGTGAFARVSTDFTVTVNAAGLTRYLPAIPDRSFLVGLPGTYRMPAIRVGGSATWTYSITGNLPTGLTFTPNIRELSGTASTAGTYNLTYVATPSTGSVVRQSFRIIVSEA